MTFNDARPSDGTNSAADSYTAANTHENFPFTVARVDILVEDNDATISFKDNGGGGYDDDQLLPTGHHSIPVEDIDGVRVKNRTAGTVAAYQLTAYASTGDS